MDTSAGVVFQRNRNQRWIKNEILIFKKLKRKRKATNKTTSFYLKGIIVISDGNTIAAIRNIIYRLIGFTKYVLGSALRETTSVSYNTEK